MTMTVDTFQREIDEAVKNYDRYIVCLQKLTTRAAPVCATALRWTTK